MLLIGAGLLVRSFRRLLIVSPGFNPRNVLTTELTMSGLRYNNPQAVLSTYKQLWQGLEQLPGATAAGTISSLPLSQMFAWGPITVEGRIPPPGENFINADIRVVNGHYFQAMQIPLLSGRYFSEADDLTHERVVIVDQYMAEQLWPGQDAVGKRIRNGGLDSKEPWIKVVGIVGRIKQYTLDSDSRIAFYLPQGQYPTRAMNVVLRTSVDPATMSAAVAQEVHRIDPNLPLYNVLTMEQRVKESLARRRFSMLLLTLFACLALVLAAIGIYGVMAYLVSQGTREIGIRMALGATPGVILKHVVRQGMTMAFSGAVVGLMGAFLLSRLIRSLLFGVRATDPLTFAVISLLLMLVALAASYIPAQRAAQVEPVVSLRYE
jgi:predicted permease